MKARSFSVGMVLGIALGFASWAQADDSNDMVGALAQLKSAPRVILVVAPEPDALTVLGDIGPFPSAMDNPAVNAQIASASSNMPAGAGAAGAAAVVVGAAIGTAIADAMVESDMREHAAQVNMPLTESLGSEGILGLARDGALRALGQLGITPAEVIIRDKRTGRYDLGIVFEKAPSATYVVVRPRVFTSRDKNSLRAELYLAVAQLKKSSGKTSNFQFGECIAEHTAASADALTGADALDVWRADSGRRARETLTEGFADAMVTMLTLQHEMPDSKRVPWLMLLRDRFIMQGYLNPLEVSAARQVIQVDDCSLMMFHDAVVRPLD